MRSRCPGKIQCRQVTTPCLEEFGPDAVEPAGEILFCVPPHLEGAKKPMDGADVETNLSSDLRDAGAVSGCAEEFQDIEDAVNGPQGG